MIIRATIALAVCTSIAIAAVGCGGGDATGKEGSTASTASTLTRAEYLKQANAACRRERASLEKDVAEFARLRRGHEKPAPLYYAELAHYVLLTDIEDEMEAIRALGAPPGPPKEEDRIDDLLYMHEIPLNLLAVAKTVTSLAAVDRKFVKSSRLLREYGLPACAQGPEATRLGNGLLKK